MPGLSKLGVETLTLDFPLGPSKAYCNKVLNLGYNRQFFSTLTLNKGYLPEPKKTYTGLIYSVSSGVRGLIYQLSIYLSMRNGYAQPRTCFLAEPL